MSVEVRANIAATVAECALALAFVSATVFVLAHIDLVGPSLYQVQTAAMMLGP